MTNDPLALLNAEYAAREPQRLGDPWTQGYQDGIDFAINVIQTPEQPNIRPLHDLLAELRDYHQYCLEFDFDDDAAGLSDALDKACVALEAITTHEYDHDYTTAVADASRALELKAITNHYV